jgi:DNA repair protein RadC
MKYYKSKIPQFKIVKQKTDIPKIKINTSSDINQFCKDYLFEELGVLETFYIVCLNRAHNIIGFYYLSKGGVCSTVVDLKIIAKISIETLSSYIILVHNHPSGSLCPSNQDMKITTKVKDGLSIFDIKVLDHIILTEESYYSFADDGLI